MEIKFNKNSGDEAIPVESEVVKTEVAPESSSVPALTKTGGFPIGDDLPGFKDVMFPRLNLVHAIGGLKDTFTPGEVVFGQTTVLFSPPIIDKKTGNPVQAATPPVNVTVVGIISKRFSEKVAGGIGGMIVDTEAAVREHGGTLDYNEFKLKEKSGMRRFENLVDMLVAIRRPESVADDDTVFTFPVGASKYALALWAVKGSAYTHAYKKVLAYARLAGCLKAGYPTHSFSLTTRLESRAGIAEPWWVPVLVPAEKSTPDFLEFVAAIVNPTK